MTGKIMSQFSIWKDCICPQGTVTVLTSMNKMPYILEILICDQNPPPPRLSHNKLLYSD